VIDLAPFGRVHQSVLDQLVGEVPSGDFYEKQAISVPYSRNGANFELSVGSDGIGEIHRFTIITNGERPDGFEASFAVIPPSHVSLVQIKLGRGLNRIKISAGGETKEWVVAATWLTLFHEAIAQDIYKNLTLPLTEYRNAILNPLGSRLLEWMIPFQDLLPDVHSFRMLAIKLLLNASINKTGTSAGIRDIVVSLTSNTPVIAQMPVISVPDEQDVPDEPITNPTPSNPELFAGSEFHVWLPNVCVLQWSTFVDIINNIREVFSLTKVTEDEIIYRFNTEFKLGEGFNEDTSVTHIHRFQYDQSRCLFSEQPALSADCFNVTAFSPGYSVESTFFFCAAQYTWDVVVEKCMALGTKYLDCGNELDVGDTLDTHDPEDPVGDGWAGFSLLGNPDEGCLDSSQGFADPDVDDVKTCCRSFAVTPLHIGYATPDAVIEELATTLAFGKIDLPVNLPGPGQILS
jgi:hypothetical protein